MASATLNNMYYYILYIIRYILLILLYYCAGSVNVFEEILLAGDLVTVNTLLILLLSVQDID